VRLPPTSPASQRGVGEESSPWCRREWSSYHDDIKTKSSLDAFTDGVERRIDLASVNERIFVNNASIGVYAQVVQEDAYRDAKFVTWRRMLPEMLGPERSIDLQFEGPKRTGWTQLSWWSRTTRIS
jgi:hypothetical protein